MVMTLCYGFVLCIFV